MKQKYYLVIGLIVIIGAIIGIVLISEWSKKDKVYSPSEVWSNRNSLVNKQIAIEGVAELDGVGCTELACSPSSSCCNTCGGKFVLRIDEVKFLEIRGEENFGQYNGKLIGCGKNECDTEFKCYPFENGKKYMMTGILKKENWEQFFEEYPKGDFVLYYFELKSFELI